MNYLQEFDHWVGRWKKNEEVFHLLMERGIRMFYNGSKFKFLMDLLSASDGLKCSTIKDIDHWMSHHDNKPSLQMQEIVVDVFTVKSDSYLRDQRLMIAAHIRFASTALLSLVNNKSNEDILARLDPEGVELFTKIFGLSSDLYGVSCKLEYPNKER